MKLTERVGLLLFAFFTLSIFILTACAVRTPVEQVSLSKVAQNLKYENIIFKEVTLASNLDSNIPTPIPIQQCEMSAISYLSSKGIFKRVEKAAIVDEGEENKNSYAEPTLFVESELTFLRIVSTAARVWGGVLVGRSAMKMNVKLKDASTGEIVAERELVGAPNAYSSAWTVGNADQTLPMKMGYLLGDFILANVSRR